MTIGNRIKRLREEKGLTQTELADLIGTTKQNIYKYETGIITNIPSDKIELMAEKLSVSPAYIMGWAESGKKVVDDYLLSNDELEKSIELALDMSGEVYASSPKYIVHYYNKLNSEGKTEATRRIAEMAKLDEYKK